MKVLKGLLISFLSIILFFSFSLFTLAFLLNQTLLKPAFINKELEQLPVSEIAKELLPQMMPQGLQLSGVPITIDQALVTEVAYSTISKLEPQLKEQAKLAVTEGYNYLLGKTGYLNIVIRLATLKTSLHDNLRQSVLDALKKSPPQVPGMTPEMVQQLVSQYFDQYFEISFQQYTAEIQDTYTISETTIPSDAMSQLRQIKVYIGYFRTGFYVLIGVMLLLVALIILLESNLKGSLRSLGLNLLLFGGTGFAIDFLFNRYAPNFMGSFLSQMAPGGMPPSIQTWAMQLSDDIAAPLQTLSIAIIAGGAVLFIASFFIKSSGPAT